jgi:hypothetical protein
MSENIRDGKFSKQVVNVGSFDARVKWGLHRLEIARNSLSESASNQTVNASNTPFEGDNTFKELPLGDELFSEIASKVDVASFYVFQGLSGHYDAEKSDGKRLGIQHSGGLLYNLAPGFDMRPLRLPIDDRGLFEKIKPVCFLYSRNVRSMSDLYVDMRRGLKYEYATTRQTIIATHEQHGDTTWPTIYFAGLFSGEFGRPKTEGFFGLAFKNDESWSKTLEIMHKIDPLTVLEQVGGRLDSKEGNFGKFPITPITEYHQEYIINDMSLVESIRLTKKMLIDQSLPLLVDIFEGPNGFDKGVRNLNGPINLKQIKYVAQDSMNFQVESINETSNYKPPEW